MKRLLDSFYIRTKQGNKVKFKRKPVQEHFAKNKTGRDYILKARQEGITTEMQLNQLEKTLTKKYTVQATIAHKRKSSEKIFRIAKFAWDNLPQNVKQLYKINTENTRELQFESMSSSYFVDIEARGETIHNLHVSEFAFVKDIDSLVASTFEAVPTNGSIVLETTGNGMNKAHEFWNDAVAGKNEFKAHFYNWTWEPDYATEPPTTQEWKEEYIDLAKKYNLILDIENRFRLHESQFYWYFLKARRLKSLTKQESPTTAEEAFLSQSNMVFDILQVSQLESSPIINKYFEVEVYEKIHSDHDYVIGIDTAEGVGGDGTAIEIIDVTDSSRIIEVGSFFDRNIRPDQTAVLAVKLGKMFNNQIKQEIIKKKFQYKPKEEIDDLISDMESTVVERPSLFNRLNNNTTNLSGLKQGVNNVTGN
jgi:hypothetical protein